jgi:DNA-binding NtrC family response regulator
MLKIKKIRSRRMRVLAEKGIRILIVDDEESIRDSCRQILARGGHKVECTGDALQGLNMALKDVYDIVLLDIRMPKMSGLDILKRMQKNALSSKVVVITGYGTIQLAVEAMRYGASDVLTKPFSAADLKEAVDKVLAQSDIRPVEENLSALIGVSDYMKDLKETIRRIAKTESTVLITGESGTGKELVAQTLHELSVRKEKPFIPVDCSSLVESLMESELFGHVKGAYSGATETREGRFQMADKGTLFLDEISNISPGVQAKLLRVIQEQEIPRVGSSKPEKVDVRLIAATNKDLRKEVEMGNFREDLFYRISVVPIHINPLREHRGDILPIADYYFEAFRKKHQSRVKRFSEEANKSLISYNWPGNIRELKNTIERLCVLSDNEVVDLSDILYYGQNEGAKAPVVDSFSGKITLVDVEKEHIEKALRHFDYHISKTAKFLGIDRKTLRMKIRNYGIETEK